MQHLSWRHLSISAISQLLLARFWPNFKGRFLGPFWTYPNCHNDICPGNISPYWQYLSLANYYPFTLGNLRGYYCIFYFCMSECMSVRPPQNQKILCWMKKFAKKNLPKIFCAQKIFLPKKNFKTKFCIKFFIAKKISPKLIFFYRRKKILPKKIFTEENFR